MDKLKFELMSPYGEGEYWAVHYNYTDTLGTRILVNGNDLVDLVNEAMGETRHGHMEPRMVYYELKCAEADRRHDFEAHIGLCNDCGDMGCDPIMCLVYTDNRKNTVKWFVGNYEDADMFEFTFERDEYDTAMSELRRLGLEHGEAAKPEHLPNDVDLYYGVEPICTLADFLYMRGYSDEAVAASRVCDKTCCFTGHRPKSFVQFCNNGKDMPEGLSEWLDKKIDYVVREHRVRRFVCGNAEGVDTWAAKAVLRYKETHPDIHLEIAVPFEGHNYHIPEIAEIQRQADEVRIVYKGKNHTEAYHKRNKYMVNKSDVVLGVCIFYVNEAKGIKDMQKGGTRRTLEYARCLDKKVYVKEYYKQIDPK